MAARSRSQNRVSTGSPRSCNAGNLPSRAQARKSGTLSTVPQRRNFPQSCHKIKSFPRMRILAQLSIASICFSRNAQATRASHGMIPGLPNEIFPKPERGQPSTTDEELSLSKSRTYNPSRTQSDSESQTKHNVILFVDPETQTPEEEDVEVSESDLQTQATAESNFGGHPTAAVTANTWQDPQDENETWTAIGVGSGLMTLIGGGLIGQYFMHGIHAENPANYQVELSWECLWGPVLFLLLSCIGIGLLTALLIGGTTAKGWKCASPVILMQCLPVGIFIGSCSVASYAKVAEDIDFMSFHSFSGAITIVGMILFGIGLVWAIFLRCKYQI